MPDGESPVLPPNQNPNQVPNQNPNQNPNQDPNQVPDRNLPQIRIPCPLLILLYQMPFSARSTSKPQLNWSHFKPEYAGRPDEDVEAHLLRTNDRMYIYNFWSMLRYKDFV